jgi:hypothetical protein
MAANVFGPLFPPAVIAQLNVSGSFSSSATQPQLTVNTPIAITYNTVETSDGITFDNSVPSRILVPQDGLYEFNYSIQFDQQTGGTTTADVWLRVNGVDVPRSASQVTVQGQQAETFMFCNYLLQLQSTDYVEVVYASGDITMAPTAFPVITTPWTRPAVPSIIVTMKLLSNY